MNLKTSNLKFIDENHPVCEIELFAELGEFASQQIDIVVRNGDKQIICNFDKERAMLIFDWLGFVLSNFEKSSGD